MTTSDARAWNVISGGPSREYLQESDLIPHSPVVTVNRAIDVLDRGLAVDFAMFADPPAHLSNVIKLDRYLVPPIQVWCPRTALMSNRGALTLFDMVSLWEPFLPASVGIRTTPFGKVPGEPGVERYIFALLGALERVMMFRPQKVRILSADMAGPWAPGMTEQQCEMHQSRLEQAKRDLVKMEERYKQHREQSIKEVVEGIKENIADMEKLGDPGLFKRWQHERRCLRRLEDRANRVGCSFEWRTPKQVVTA